MSYAISSGYRGVQTSNFNHRGKIRVYDYEKDFGITERVFNREYDFYFAYLAESGLMPRGTERDLNIEGSLFEKKNDAELIIRFSQAYIDLFEAQKDLDFILLEREGIFRLVEFKKIAEQKTYIALGLNWTEIE